MIDVRLAPASPTRSSSRGRALDAVMEGAVAPRTPSLATNVVASYAGRLFSAALGFVFPPLFARILGSEGYGLVGFFASLTAVLSVLDVGLSATLQRELAKLAADGSAEGTRRAASLVKTFAAAFWLLGAVLGCGVVALAPRLSAEWLRSGAVPSSTTVFAVRAMGVAIALWWPASMYSGVLLGLQQQVRSNVALAISTAMRFVGAAVVLAFVSPTVEAFFLWQIVAAAGQLAMTRQFAVGVVRGPGVFDPSLLARLWKFSAGVWVVSVLVLAITQADKVIGSHALSLAAFGDYSLAASVATGIVYLTSPLWAIFYPRLCQLANDRDGSAIGRAYHQGAQLMTVAVAPACAVIAFFGPEILLAWTGNVELVARLRWPATLLVLGAGASGLMFLPFAAQLAYGLTVPCTIAGGVTVAAMIAGLPWLAATRGGVGLAAGWAMMTAGHAGAMAWLTHARVLRGHGLPWLTVDVVFPTLGAVACSFLARSVLPLASTRWGGALTAAVAFAPTLAIAAWLAPLVRAELRARLANVLRRYAR